MPKPRRRRFFALEGRFEVDDSGEVQSIVQSEPSDAGAAAQEVEENEEPGGTDPAPPGLLEPPGAPSSSPDDLPPAFRLQRTSRPRTEETEGRFPVGSVLCLAAGLAAGVLAGYYLPRSVPKGPVTEAPIAVLHDAYTLTPADQEDLDAAYAARHVRNFARAEQLFAALERRHPGWGPVQVEIGRTQFYENKSSDAGFTLKAAADKGASPAEANFLIGMLNKAKKNYPDAETSFAKATAIDPTQPEYYFFWGECLRDQGKLLDAITKFRSALLRNQYETATGLYRAKLWLCVIEADQAADTGVNAEIDAALAEPHPTMDALVAAAARDIKAKDFQAARAHLSSAVERADPAVFRYILGDPIFAEVRSKPDFANPLQQAPIAAGSPTPTPTH